MKLIPTLQLSVLHLFTTDHMKLMCTVDGSGWFHTTYTFEVSRLVKTSDSGRRRHGDPIHICFAPYKRKTK